MKRNKILLILLLLVLLIWGIFYLFKPTDLLLNLLAEKDSKASIPDYEPGRMYTSDSVKLPPADMAVLPVIIHRPKGYAFDAGLRRGFDRTATAVSEAFSSATFPLRGAVDEVQRRHYPIVFNVDPPVFGEDEKAVALLNESCKALNVKVIFFAEMEITEDAINLTLRDFDCLKGAGGVWDRVMSSDQSLPSTMEELEMEGALAVSEEILRRFPGDHGSLSDGPSKEGTDEALLSECESLLSQNDPFSLIRAIDGFSRNIANNPRDPRTWAGLSFAWFMLGYDFKDLPGIAERYWVPAFAASRIALMIDPEDSHANLSASWVDRHMCREARAKEEMQKSLELAPSYPRALLIQARLDKDIPKIEHHIKQNLEDTFARRMLEEVSPVEDRLEMYRSLHEKKPYQRLWSMSRLGFIYSNQNSFPLAIRYYLSTIEISSAFGRKAMDEMRKEWEKGVRPLAPEFSGAEMVDLTQAENPGMIAMLYERFFPSEGSYTPIKEYKERQSQWLAGLLQYPSRFGKAPVASVNADPFLFSEYVDSINFLLLDLHLLMLKSIHWPDEWRESISELISLYPDTAETYASAIRFHYGIKEFKQAEKLSGKNFRKYEDNTALLDITIDCAISYFEDVHLQYQVSRVPLRWPYDYQLNIKTLKFLENVSGPMPVEKMLDAAISARPYEKYAFEKKLGLLRDRAEFEGLEKYEEYLGPPTPSIPSSVQERIEFFENYLNKHPEYLKGFDNLSDYYLQLGDLDSAVRTRERKLRRSKEPLSQVSVLRKLGDMYLDNDMPEKAMERYIEAAKISYWSGNAIDGLARGYNGLGEYEKADAEFQRGLERYPDNTYALVSWARCLMKRGDFERSGEMLKKAMDKEWSNERLNYFLELQIRQNKTESLGSFDSLSMFKKSSLLYYLGLWNLHCKDDIKLAEKIYNMMEEQKENLYMYYLAFDMAYSQGKYGEAEDIIDHIREDGKVFGPENYVYRYVLSKASRKKFRQLDREVVNIYRMQFDACLDQMIAALIAVKKRRIPTARHHLEILSQSYMIPVSFDLEYYMAELYWEFASKSRKKADYELFLKTCQRMRRRSDFPYLWDYYLGRCYEGMRNKTKARESYQSALSYSSGFTKAQRRLDALK